MIINFGRRKFIRRCPKNIKPNKFAPKLSYIDLYVLITFGTGCFRGRERGAGNQTIKNTVYRWYQMLSDPLEPKGDLAKYMIF